MVDSNSVSPTKISAFCFARTSCFSLKTKVAQLINQSNITKATGQVSRSNNSAKGEEN
jgi:hypothetical protein